MIDHTHLHEPKTIQHIWSDSQTIGFTMPSEPLSCSLLRTLAASKPNGKLLELGSGTGLSTAWILDGMSKSAHLTTVDNDEALLSVLKKHLNDQRLTIVCEDGDTFLAKLKGQKFDLIFADTWSGKYRLLNEALDLLNIGGLYIIDDMLPQPNWPEGHAEKAADLITALENKSYLHITKMSWASGLVIATKLDSSI